MCPSVDRPMPHLSLPADVTTINYTLDWPRLENPSNTTFVGQNQIDICRCQRADLSPHKDSEPGHIYTRFKCAGPTVHFKTSDDQLWVLEAPRGPLNMLRPANQDEHDRRRRVHYAADPAVYRDATFLFLTGPCPRGRYQAYATQQWLESLSLDARSHISSLCLLIQPYEEDCSDDATRRAYADLAAYLLQHVPGLKTLYLFICPNGIRMWNTAREFSILLENSAGTKIVVGGDDYSWGGETREFTDAAAFLDAENTFPRPREMSPAQGPADVTMVDEVAVAKDKEGQEEDEEEEEYHDAITESPPPETSEDDSVDGEWVDAAMSPASPYKETDKDWQLL